MRVSPLCFGTDNFADPTPEAECIEMLDRAFDAGNLLDTGDWVSTPRERAKGSSAERSRPTAVATRRSFRPRSITFRE